jgi:hypothetical protein
MGRIICVAGTYPVMRGNVEVGREFVVSHGIDEDTLQDVPLQQVHPSKLGAVFDRQLQEWVLESAPQAHTPRGG